MQPANWNSLLSGLVVVGGMRWRREMNTSAIDVVKIPLTITIASIWSCKNRSAFTQEIILQKVPVNNLC